MERKELVIDGAKTKIIIQKGTKVYVSKNRYAQYKLLSGCNGSVLVTPYPGMVMTSFNDKVSFYVIKEEIDKVYLEVFDDGYDEDRNYIKRVFNGNPKLTWIELNEEVC